jgi:hypothetical protein
MTQIPVKVSSPLQQARLVKSQADGLYAAALSAVQGLYDDLSRMLKHPNTLQGDS